MLWTKLLIVTLERCQSWGGIRKTTFLLFSSEWSMFLCGWTWRKDSRIPLFHPCTGDTAQQAEGLMSAQLGSKLGSLRHCIDGLGQVSHPLWLLLSYNNGAKWPSSKTVIRLTRGSRRSWCCWSGTSYVLPATGFLPPWPPSSSPSHSLPGSPAKGATFTQRLASALGGAPTKRTCGAPDVSRCSLEHLLLLHCLTSNQHVPPLCGWPDSYVSLSKFANPGFANLDGFSP